MIGNMTKLATLILAGGKGTRMKSNLVKVLHPIMGKSMLSYPIEASLEGLGSPKTIVVVGYQAERIQDAFSDNRLTFVHQKPQLGSGHAVLCAEGAFRGYDGTILILCGDVPLVQTQTLKELVAFHRRQRATLTVATTRLTDPSGYGRVVRKEGDHVEKIVEEKDASPQVSKIEEVNTGLYCVETSFLFPALKQVQSNNRQGEYYLTDIVKIGRNENRKVVAFHVSDADQFLGINTRVDLARAHEIVRDRYLRKWMLDGVTIIDPNTTYIESGVIMGKDTVIYANCVIQGETAIGSHCSIGPNCLIRDSNIDDRVTVRAFSVIEESRIARGALIGPFSRLRPQSQISEDARVGNFVEVKKSLIGKGSKVNHLAYIGDATLGEKVNIGAGTIFCNYDGIEKHPTIVGKRVFVGSNAELVAPLRIGNDAVVGAGSTITRDVPDKSLAVSRTKQKNIEGWGEKRIKKKHPRRDD
jgi:bifunctional UDP-N-acetylglucosamine pyrophosphorylase/glucosamine-1-phosphate N-acetyltransferase